MQYTWIDIEQHVAFSGIYAFALQPLNAICAKLRLGFWKCKNLYLRIRQTKGF